jgi:drug/metabolite transporter (DMT)-like permease
MYLFITIALTVYGQLVLKWRLDKVTIRDEGLIKTAFMFLTLLSDPYVFSSFLSAFIASLTWMATLREFELSKAYPFMNISLVLVVFFSVILFNETFSFIKVIGCLLIILGVYFVAKG